MIETKDLYLDKAKFSDWEAMYCNVWSRPESAKYMFWNATTSEADARLRMQRTIEFQKNHDTYLVYEKASGQAIGWAGVEQAGPRVCQEAGICLGPAFVRRGYGTQILQALLDHSREVYGAEEFRCFSRADNEATRALVQKLGFRLVSARWEASCRDGSPVQILTYSKQLDAPL